MNKIEVYSRLMKENLDIFEETPGVNGYRLIPASLSDLRRKSMYYDILKEFKESSLDCVRVRVTNQDGKKVTSNSMRASIHRVMKIYHPEFLGICYRQNGDYGYLLKGDSFE